MQRLEASLCRSPGKKTGTSLQFDSGAESLYPLVSCCLIGNLFSSKFSGRSLFCQHSQSVSVIIRHFSPFTCNNLKISILSISTRTFLLALLQLINLNDSREAVYGTLDGWVAWERSFPLVSLKRILITLEKEEQWHRVVQVIKWMLSKGQGRTMGTYEQLIRALEKDHRAEEAHRIWLKKIGSDIHSVPWRVCDLMVSIYYRNNMLERLIKLFKALESFDRKSPSKSIVQKVADAYEMMGSSEEKNRVLEKYSSLFSEAAAAGHPRKPRRAVKKPICRRPTSASSNPPYYSLSLSLP
ncbi:unnamed protein product [Spirodela intermedia]|uniref:Uncharacterized protein n=1 Tax=Spirodela intermedia TaxID=51605 RepID=A0A7I8KKF4_SPIIN|nr:unnamed protein product [Spirodela intermedia]